MLHLLISMFVFAIPCSFDGANIDAFFRILSFCRIFLSQFNTSAILLNGY